MKTVTRFVNGWDAFEPSVWTSPGGVRLADYPSKEARLSMRVGRCDQMGRMSTWVLFPLNRRGFA